VSPRASSGYCVLTSLTPAVIVNEPTVPETISILRGIKQKYEVHHGVQILDSALVAAATLASRYLTSYVLSRSNLLFPF
jgi:ATP-dependent Clp protease ATP-binding subunit ClpA